MLRASLITSYCLMAAAAFAEPQVFKSGLQKPNIIELYTSEGCSSCPPADKWLNTLTTSPELFTSFIPMAFHVDYWNWLGWSDEFSEQQFSERQYQHVKQRHLSQAYTPGFVVNDEEWRGWFRGERQWPTQAAEAERLTLTVNGNTVQVNYDAQVPMIAHVALLGMGIESIIEKGENRGKTLNHNFVVLNLSTQEGMASWTFDHNTATALKAPRTAIVAWVSEPGSVAISQAVAGFLTDPQGH